MLAGDYYTCGSHRLPKRQQLKKYNEKEEEELLGRGGGGGEAGHRHLVHHVYCFSLVLFISFTHTLSTLENVSLDFVQTSDLTKG